MPSNPWVWYEIMADDAEAAKAFYTSVMGWTTSPFPGSEPPYTILEGQGGGLGGIMGLTPEMKAGGAQPSWMGHVAVDDVDAKAAEVTAAGGRIVHGPIDIPTVGRFAVAVDRQGASFSIFKSLQDPGENCGLPPPMTPGHIGWRELHTSDWEDAFDFYSGLFGWKKLDTFDMGPMGQYQIIEINDLAGGGLMNNPIPPRWVFYTRLADDIDAGAARIVAGGGRILHGPSEVPGGDWTLIALDPEGATFGLVAPKKP
ncbi:VOC family protein [Sphingomonas naphthae]|uniref:VOC family protein n=1 Tax=Sphingomonas naphthae TaxID=1813468 RepID=A0ABY7TKQ3_9SPHN|nr:VOC family protein [Sphingomonas naphthae]WCT73361.1 VOC family protein [Sphingomonas naphthae]